MQLSRRRFLGSMITLAAVGPLVAACSPAAAPTAAPTAAPANSGEAPKPAESKPAAPAANALVYYTGLTGGDGDVMRNMVAKANGASKDFQVNMEVMPWADMFAKMVATMAAGNPLDVVLTHPYDSVSFLEQEAFLPVMDFLTPLGVKLDDFVASTVKGCTYNGMVYALPFDQFHPMMYVRTDIAKEAGVDVSKPPANMMEFMDRAKKLTKKEGGKITVSGLGLDYPNPWGLALTAIHQNGGVVYTPDASKSTINSPQAVEAVEWLLSLYDDVGASGAGAQMDAVIKGVSAQAYGGPHWVPQMVRSVADKFDTYMMPTLFKQSAVGPGGNHCLVLTKQKDKTRIEQGAKFIKAISDDSLAWVEAGNLPAKKTIIESDEFKKIPYRKPLVDAIPVLTMYPNARFYAELTSPTGAQRKNFEAIISKQIGVKEGLAKMEKEINEVLSRPK